MLVLSRIADHPLIASTNAATERCCRGVSPRAEPKTDRLNAGLYKIGHLPNIIRRARIQIYNSVREALTFNRPDL